MSYCCKRNFSNLKEKKSLNKGSITIMSYSNKMTIVRMLRIWPHLPKKAIQSSDIKRISWLGVFERVLYSGELIVIGTSSLLNTLLSSSILLWNKMIDQEEP